MSAQDLYIKFDSGNSVNYGLSTVERITFSATDMLTHLSSGSIQNYGLDSIRHYRYQTSTTQIVEDSNLELRQLKLYPNPSLGYLHLEYTVNKGAQMSLNLYTLSWQLLSSKKLFSASGRKKTTLDLRTKEISSGAYFLEIKCGNERHIEKLILK